MKKFFTLLLLTVFAIAIPAFAAENNGAEEYNANGYSAEDYARYNTNGNGNGNGTIENYNANGNGNGTLENYNANGYGTSNGILLAPLPVSIDGYIEDVTETSIKVVSRVGEGQIILNISPETYIVDASTGQPLSLADRSNNHVIAYYGPALALSEPPQGNALLILGNIPGDTALPQFGKVEAIETVENGIIATMHGGSLMVTIERDSQIEPFLTRNIVTVDHIEVGSDLLIWSPMIAISYPAQTTAQKTIILNRGVTNGYNGIDGNGNGYLNGYLNGYNGINGNGNGYLNGYLNGYNGINGNGNGYLNGYLNGYNGINGNGNGYLNGYNGINGYSNGYLNRYNYLPHQGISLTDALAQSYSSEFYTENNVLMVPLRKIAEFMGFTVMWNENNQSVALQHADGQKFSAIALGQNSFEGRILEVAPKIRNDRAFVPVTFFEILLGI